MQQIERLLDVMKALRNPKTGCPWDIEQNFETIAKYTIEEAYEVVDAIEQKDYNELKEELGDLLLQVVFHSQIAKEQNLFDFEDVAKAISDKMISRHPHVFGDNSNCNNADQVLTQWEDIKAQERKEKQKGDTSLLDSVAKGFPPIIKAEKLQKKAAKVGFEWDHPSGATEKLVEESNELHEAIKNNDKKNIEEEIGDTMFCLINIARMLDIDPEKALRQTNKKFERRFRAVETGLKHQGKDITKASLEEMDAIWDEQKRLEKEAS